jgi:DNA-binding HxlR family transcriptional regulator
MASRGYGQFCGLARALEIVGERWAMLIVRDLLVSPRRYTDLRIGLPKIPTNILAARLKELEAAGLVRRRVLPRPDGSIVYELTELGRGLEDTLVQLGRWGARLLEQPRPDEIVTPASLVMALRTTFDPIAARDLHAAYELRIGPVVVHARIQHGVMSAGEGGLTGADLVIEAGPQIRALMAGELTPADALAFGSVRVTGDEALLTSFVRAFPIPARH